MSTYVSQTRYSPGRSRDNIYGDKLPIIPSDARVEHGMILYRLEFKATIRSRTGSPISIRHIRIKTNRNDDRLEISPPSDPDVSSAALIIELGDAWYESTFLITGYHVCHEADFSGEVVFAQGVNDRHKRDFLYGARGVVMQGTSMALNGQYIRPTRVASAWHRDIRGNRDYLEIDRVAFAYANSVLGSYGPVTAHHSIAVDPIVIPKHAQVDIEMVGRRFADDTGCAIVGHHIDNFVGAGAPVQAAWERGPVNDTRRRVKYIRTVKGTSR
jgi:3D (Asp-Asp-Asp) domain-containing protein